MNIVHDITTLQKEDLILQSVSVYHLQYKLYLPNMNTVHDITTLQKEDSILQSVSIYDLQYKKIHISVTQLAFYLFLIYSHESAFLIIILSTMFAF